MAVAGLAGLLWEQWMVLECVISSEEALCQSHCCGCNGLNMGLCSGTSMGMYVMSGVAVLAVP